MAFRSGVWSRVNDFVDQIPGVTLERLPSDPEGEPAARYWFILDNENRRFTAIDVERGYAWRRDGAIEPLEPMTLYNKHDGRIDALVKEVAPHVE